MPDEQPPSSKNVPTRPAPHPVQPPPASLVVQRGAQAGEEIKLQPGVNLFGREEGILLHDQRVSRRHAQIQDIGGEYMLIDLHSTNGSYVNGQRVTQPTLLQHGDILRFGDTILKLRFAGEGSQDPNVVGARTSELPPDRLNATTLLASRMKPEITTDGLPPGVPDPTDKIPGKAPKPEDR